ncbi:MAG: AraC family transcriptional regulator [Bacteroidota bacterium]
MTLYQRIVRAKLFIDQQYHQPLSLDNLSDAAYFSRFHFLRLFRQLYRVTPHQYLTRKRIEAAKDLLAHSEISIAEISYRVGFQSAPHFNATFRKWTGTFPTQYRETQRRQFRQAKEQPEITIPFCFVRNYCPAE